MTFYRDVTQYNLDGKIYVVAGVHFRTQSDLKRGMPLGLGESLTRKLLSEGAKVIGTYHGAAPTFSDIDFHPFELEANDARAYESLADFIEHEFGQIDAAMHTIMRIEGLKGKSRIVVDRMRQNVELVKNGTLPNPDVLRVDDFNEDEKLATLETSVGSYIKLVNSIGDLMPNGSQVITYSFMQHESMPNYGIASMAKKQLETMASGFANEKNGLQFLVLRPSIFESPSLYGIPYAKELVGYMKSQMSEGETMLTANDVAALTIYVLANTNEFESGDVVDFGALPFDLSRFPEILAEELLKKELVKSGKEKEAA